MSVLELTETADLRAITSDSIAETLFLLSNDERERSEGFTNIMNRARELGAANEVSDFYQTAAQYYGHKELWELPKPLLAQAETSPLPKNALPKTLQEYLNAVSASVQVYPEMCVLPLLSVLSLCVQGKAIIRNPGGGNLESLNLYTVTVAEPGERKSGVFRAVTEPMYKFQRDENKRLEPLIKEYHAKKVSLEKQIETAVRAKKSQDEIAELQLEMDELTPVNRINLNVDDTTTEAIVGELEQNDEKIGILSDEGGIFDILSGMYSKGAVNIDLFLKAYDGSHYHCSRIGRGSVDLEHPLITLGVMTQPQSFEKAMGNPVFVGRGLIHRCMFAFPKSKSGNRAFRSEFIDNNVRADYERLIERLLSMKRPTAPPIITCDKEATNLFHDYFNSVEMRLKQGGEFHDLKEWANKQLGKTLRIAGIFHLCEHDPTEPLNGDAAYKAIQIAMWQEGQAKRAFEGVTVEREVSDAEYIIEKVGNTRVREYTKTELVRLCRRFKSVRHMNDALELLESCHYLKAIIDDQNGKRKPNVKYIFNPLSFMKH